MIGIKMILVITSSFDKTIDYIVKNIALTIFTG